MSTHLFPEHVHALTERVSAGVDAVEAEKRTLHAIRPTDPIAHAVRAERLALLHARIAGWYVILLVGTRDGSVPWLWRRTVITARQDARDRARFWRDTAADWRARAERRPTSDAAGALSNWSELGVTA